MSPEQVRGVPVDCRTDLFSFGAVLYAMATGQKPFAAATGGLVQEAILNRAPISLLQLNRTLPAPLEGIVNRALEKDPAGRYQRASEIRRDLEQLMRDLKPARMSSIAAPVPRPPFQRRRTRFLLIAFPVAAVVAAVLWWRPWNTPAVPSWRVLPLTSLAGAEWSPTFSPDSSQAAFAWNGEKQDNVDIYVKIIGADAAQPLRLTSDPASDLDPAWSPDGRWIAFRRVTPIEHQILLISPLGGGAERKLCTLPCPAGHCSNRLWANRLSWSPDSNVLAFSDALWPHSAGRIFLLDVRTREKRLLDLPPAGGFMSATTPVFSPDGSKLAFVAGETGREYIYVQPLNRSLLSVGQPKRLVQTCGYPGVDWTADGHALIYSCDDLFRISADGGRPERLPGLLGDTLAVSRHGQRLAYSAASPLGSVISNIYRAPRHSGEISRFFVSSYGSGNAQYSEDGTKIVFASLRGSTREIWVCSSNGTECYPLTSVGGAGSPRFSPDGRQVTFDCGKYGSWDIFVIPTEGGAARRLTFEDSTDARTSWSRDGRWIYFTSDRSGESQVWRIPAQGGTARQVTKNGGFEAVEDRGGKALYYIKRGEYGIWTVPAAGGPETRVVDQGEEGRWALGAQGIYLLSKNDLWAIDYFDFAKRQVSRVRMLPTQDLFAMRGAGPEFAVSPDEQWFLYTAVERNETDLMAVENFR